MPVRVNGRDYDGGVHGVVLTAYADVPVFHRYEKCERRGPVSPYAYEDLSACGLVLHSANVRAVADLPLRHVVKFARPCSRCFPPAPGGDQ